MSKYNYERLLEQIIDMGIMPNDTVIIHSSMKAIGDVEGGADTVIDVFKDYLSEEGLFLVPTLTYKETRKTLFFDVKETQPCIGIIPVLASKREDGFRSINPTHSMMAFGKRAKEYIQDEEQLVSPTAKGGCFDRLADVGAKILLLGVKQDKNTFIHTVDEINNTYRVSEEIYPIKSKLVDGTIIDTPHRPLKHTPLGVSVSHHFNKFEKIFYENDVLQYGKFGDAQVQICNATKIRNILEELIKLNEGYDLFVDDEIPRLVNE